MRHHHEALDGTGYPDGLSAEQIPELTRILTVCDIYAALIERRAYKEEKTPADAVTLLVDMALRSKVDYRMVRQLSLAVGVPAEDTLEDVLRAVTMKKRRAS